YDQLSFSPEILGTSMDFLLPNSKVMVKYIDDKPVSIEVPATIDMTVTDTPPSLKGATATNQYKEAVQDAGLKVMVPPSIGPRGVGLGDVEAKRHDQGRRLEQADELQGVVERLQVALVADVLRQRHVHVEAEPVALPVFVGEAGEVGVGEARMPVNRDGQDVG